MSRRPIVQTQNPFIVALGFLLCGGLCCINLAKLFSTRDADSSDDDNNDFIAQPQPVPSQIYVVDVQQSGVIQRRGPSSESTSASAMNLHSIFQMPQEKNDGSALPKGNSSEFDPEWDACATVANFTRNQ